MYLSCFTDKFRQAVMEGDYQLVRKALNSRNKFDVDAADDLGITLLMYSALYGKLVLYWYFKLSV